MNDWTSLIYVFFEPVPEIEYHDKHCCHKDAKSTSNRQKHVKSCWGDAALQAVMESGNTAAAQDGLTGHYILLLHTLSIKTSLEQKGKGKVMYSHCQHTCSETSLQPFETVNDRGFQNPMKTGCPEYYIPSPSTITRDVKQNYDSELNFATDTWTSPNHRAYVAISVHLQHEGQPLSIILDIVEVVLQ
ncbi:uncharacterized protein EDB91DRAFT_1239010 [Suillus paluster]|uniref:uncharacterized protein n=1 Tax=Suillus paluster TaxID=48578 RepID=UPI001B86D1D7|nr:uncharacterized protein EDB91DRAFT_1239010 [Suillus paluster]KAG1730979.1 hypothetical protein EDB91DRAFT_1239010 [Suillus paluster]